MRRLISIFLLFNAFFLVWGQTTPDSKRNSSWLFGYNGPNTYYVPKYCVSEVKFDTAGYSINVVDSFADFSATVAIACDTSGKRLFSTNGIWLYDRNFNKIQGSDTLTPGLFGEDWVQSGYFIPQDALILPLPNSDSIYYVFHERLYDTVFYYGNETEGLYYTTVDVTKNNGLGAVIDWRVPIVQNDTLEHGKLTACRHANGRDWWIIVMNRQLNRYRQLLLDVEGLHDFGWQSIVGSALMLPGTGQATFTPDGKKFLIWSGLDAIHGDYLTSFDFDRCLGALSNTHQYNFHDSCGTDGISVSPNSKYMYSSCGPKLYQYKLDSSDIASTKVLVAVWDGFVDPDFSFGTTMFYLMGNTPNGKILISTPSSTKYLHLIESPNEGGVNCNVSQHAINLPGFNSRSMANYPNFLLGAATGTVCDSLNIPQSINPVYESSKPSYTVEAFPNPCSNYCNISFGTTLKSDGQIEVFDPLGKLIFKSPIQKASLGYTVNTSFWHSGLYRIVISANQSKLGSVSVVKL
ncbi:MAG: T9SS type A sorting domain-containing protein [Chitinophagales bacterium]